MQFKKILVPVDGSGTADNALRYGVEMAKTYGAQLFVTVVADIGEAAYPLMQVNLDRNGFASVREKAEAVMERIKKQIPQGLPFTPIIRTGVPGSVSQYVIHHVKVPVLIIK